MIWFARWNGWSTPHEDNDDMIGYMEAQRERERVFQEQIAALGGRVPRSSRMQPRSSRPAHHGRIGARGEMRIFMPDSTRGPPVVVRGRHGWTLGSKLIAVGAGVVLVVGVALTLMTVNSKLAMDTYRPFIYTIFGVLFIIVAPMVACRMVLNAYDRRLLREQRQFESMTRRIRRQGHSADAASSRLPTSITSRAQLAAEFFFGPSRASLPAQSGCSNRDASDCFPDTLPSYNSALDLTDNEHWMKKFFRDSPPTYEEAVIEMRVIRPLIPVGRRRSLSLSDIRADAVSSASHSGTTAEQSDGPSQNDPTEQTDQSDPSGQSGQSDQNDHVEVVPDEESVATSPTSTTADDQQLLRNENSGDDRG